MPSFDNLYYYRPSTPLVDPPAIRADVVVYGATVAGIAAAAQLRADGFSVAVAEFSGHLGGVTTSGLGRTDFGNKTVFGGLARQFYRDVGAFYAAAPDRGAAIDDDGATWYFEPSVAESVLNQWVDHHTIDIRYRQRIADVVTRSGRIVRAVMEDGSQYEADVFIDASYEGDLLARAGVSYRVGREGNDERGETLNGIQFGSEFHQFNVPIDPYVRPGRPDSGLLPLISDASPGRPGDADTSVQAYNFRLCLSDDPGNRLPFPAPAGYDPARYELLARYVNAGVFDVMDLTVAMPNGKYDMNNRGAVASDHIGANHDWPDADYARRQEIFADHVSYTMGLLYFLSNDDSIPRPVRHRMSQWGLPADEFADTGHWPRQLYIREARRMVAGVVMTEQHARGAATAPDPVALAAYQIDSHHCRRLLVDGVCRNEGDVQQGVKRPYPISYRALVPRAEECLNLAAPVCLSATHIAYGSIRMEPVFFALGQAVGAAAGIALDTGRALADVDYPTLRDKLLGLGQVLPPTGV